MKVNFHTHTARCGHAVGSDREYVEDAIEAGIKTLGFSDHVPQPFRSGYHSHIRMSVPETADYLRSIHSLRDEYKDEITIYAGFESEYFPDLFSEMLKTLSVHDYDYLIFGAHFIPDEISGFYSGDSTTSEADLAAYVENVLAGLHTGVFTYLAHPDLINYHGPLETYDKYMLQICETAKKLNIPLEVNMNGLVCERNYPTEHFFSLAKECGNTFVVGVDAHDPRAFLKKEDFEKTDDFIRRTGITVTEDFPIVNPKNIN